MRFLQNWLTEHILNDEFQGLYGSKDGKNEKTFDALEWLAAMCSHVPNKGEQMVRYYGYYSNVCRGQRKKANEDGLVPSISQPDESSKGYRKNWARLIQKIYEIDPLTCPKPVLSLSKDAMGRWPSSLLLKPKRSSNTSVYGSSRSGPHPQSRKRSPNTPCIIRLFRLTTPFFR